MEDVFLICIYSKGGWEGKRESYYYDFFLWLLFFDGINYWVIGSLV